MEQDKWQVRVVIDGAEHVLTVENDAALEAKLVHMKSLGIPLDQVTVLPNREVMTGEQWRRVYMGIKEV